MKVTALSKVERGWRGSVRADGRVRTSCAAADKLRSSYSYDVVEGLEGEGGPTTWTTEGGVRCETERESVSLNKLTAHHKEDFNV